ncbi:MAG: beta-lactamase family protein [Halanaerobiales bacterium]|nr:beta-lactamase family protein [Halanaerobiales bacterium]
MKDKKYLFILLIFLFIITTFLFNSSIKAEDINNIKAVKSYFDGFIESQMEEYKVPGVTISLVKDGEIIFKKGYGYYDLENNKLVDPENTLFRPGSASKLFIWTAVMQLVEQNKLDLNTDINQYLDFKIPNQVVGINKDKIKPITVLDLMNHTAGFEDKVVKLFVLNKNDIKPLDQYLKENIPIRIFPVGQEMAYSNYGAALAAYLVQKVSNLNFDQYVKQNIFEPLKMNNSTFRQPIPEEISAESSYGYRYKNGSYIKDEFEYIQLYPAGSLSSTAQDMAKFMIAHLNNGSYLDQSILNPETIEFMHSQSFNHYNDFAGMAHGFIEMNYQGYRIISHGGDTLLFHTGLYLIPELNTGLFVSYNGKDAARARDLLFRNFLDRFFPSKDNQTVISDQSNFINQKLLVGNYYSNRYNHSSLESILKIMMSYNVSLNQDQNLVYNYMNEINKLEQIRPAVFYDQSSNSKVYAKLNKNGNVTELLTNNPNVLKRMSWYEGQLFNLIFIVGYIILTLILTIIWIKSIFRRSVRKKYMLEKVIPVIYGLITVGFFIVIVYLLTNNHPVYGVPMMFLKSSPLLQKIKLLIWILPILLIVQIIMNFKIWSITSWTIKYRVLYTFYTLWSAGIIWWFYHWNILKL